MVFTLTRVKAKLKTQNTWNKSWQMHRSKQPEKAAPSPPAQWTIMQCMWHVILRKGYCHRMSMNINSVDKQFMNAQLKSIECFRYFFPSCIQLALQPKTLISISMSIGNTEPFQRFSRSSCHSDKICTAICCILPIWRKLSQWLIWS